jgi:hypothetical protein
VTAQWKGWPANTPTPVTVLEKATWNCTAKSAPDEMPLMVMFAMLSFPLVAINGRNMGSSIDLLCRGWSPPILACCEPLLLSTNKNKVDEGARVAKMNTILLIVFPHEIKQ